MTRLYTFLCAALLALALSSYASAQSTDGSLCSDCADQINTVYLCGGQVAAGSDTDCGPVLLPDRTGGGRWVIRINKVQAACPWTNMTIEESDQITQGAPTVWHTVTVLTGPTSPSMSEFVPTHVIGPAVRATFVDITDGNCTDVRVVLRWRPQ